MIVLFDLDGTVLTFDDAPPGPGRTAMDAAMHALFGVSGASDGVRFAGGTDHAIVRALLLKCGVPAHEIDRPRIDAALEVYLEELGRVLEKRRYRPVGDVRRAVAGCLSLGARVGVATGNVRAGARLKLASAGLDGLFDLDLGGYGCDAEPRPEILRAALRRCTHAGERIFVVGDTLHDVTAARAIGAFAVGVATNARVREELVEAGADAIVDDCGHAVIEAIEAIAARA